MVAMSEWMQYQRELCYLGRGSSMPSLAKGS